MYSTFLQISRLPFQNSFKPELAKPANLPFKAQAPLPREKLKVPQPLFPQSDKSTTLQTRGQQIFFTLEPKRKWRVVVVVAVIVVMVVAVVEAAVAVAVEVVEVVVVVVVQVLSI